MQVTIKTPSRIHLGLIDLDGGLGRIYGSIGLALDNPSIILEAKESDTLQIIGADSERVKAMVEMFSQAYNIDPLAEINVTQIIPEHVGLGSGTQLSLAVASALSHINRLSVDIRELAASMKRGQISGIGTESFRKGGFVIDSGKKVNSVEGIPLPIYRINFPEDWTFILAIPSVEKGLSGKEEESAFEKISPKSSKIAKNICRLLQMKMLPALVEKDIAIFGQSLMEVDKEVGLYFKEVQNGIYKEPLTQRLIDCMIDAGSYGAGQSSWGPVVYGLIDDAGAQKLESAVDSFLGENNLNGTVIRTHANNQGAKISIIEDTS